MRWGPTTLRLSGALTATAALAGGVAYGLNPDVEATLRSGNVVFVRVGDTSHGAISRVLTRNRVVALSFDDGPDPRFTPAVLATLRRHHGHATFFDVGANALAYPRLVRREVRTGNEVANHTLDHVHLRHLGPAATRDQVDGGRRALIAAGAPDPLLLRAPYGEFTSNLVAAAAGRGELLTGWSLSVERALDGQTIPAAVAWLMRRVTPGTIILAHDGRLDRARTIQALPLLLDQLARRGYRVLSVSELLRRDGHLTARGLRTLGLPPRSTRPRIAFSGVRTS